MRAHDPEGNIAQRRPAETTTGVAGSIAILVCAVFDITDPDVILAMAGVIAWLPVLVTFLVGLRG
jgi:hypothetical protein